MKATLQEMLRQLMDVQGHSEPEREEEGEGPRPAKQRRLANCTMAVFRSWYQDSVQVRVCTCVCVCMCVCVREGKSCVCERGGEVCEIIDSI